MNGHTVKSVLSYFAFAIISDCVLKVPVAGWFYNLHNTFVDLYFVVV